MSESNRHDNRTARDWINAWLGVVLILIAAVSTAILGFEREWMGLSLGVLLLLELLPRVRRQFHAAMHADEILTQREEVRASNTGTWRLYVEGEAPDRFTITWDAWGRQYRSEGRTEAGAPNATWVDSLTLASYVEGLERAGWVPNDDEATRAIRGRLDLAPLKREDTL